MRYFTRGTVIDFPGTFVDENGNPAAPDTVEILIRYPFQNDWVNTTATLTANGSSFSVLWDSSVSDPGIVYSTIVASGGINQITTDDMVVLRGNASNVQIGNFNPLAIIVNAP